MSTLSNVETPGVEANTPSISVVSDAIPQAVNIQNGVSVECIYVPENQVDTRMYFSIHTIIERLKNSSLAKDSFWAVFGNGLGNFLLLLGGIIIARLLGKDLYGEYGVVKTTMFYIAGFATFGLGYTSTKFVAEYLKTAKEHVLSIVKASTGITLVISTILCCILFFFSTNLANYINEPSLANAFRYLGIIIVFKALSQTGSGILAGLKRFKSLGINNIISGFTLLICGAVFTFLWGIHGSLLALLFSQAILFFLNYYHIYKESRHLTHSTSSFYQKLLTFSLPVSIQELSFTISNWGVTLLIAKYANVGEVGLYSAAAQWNTIVMFIPVLLSNVVISYLSDDATNSSEHHSMFRKLLLVNFICAIIPFLIVFSLSGFIASFYGASFVGLSTIISMMVFSTIFSTMAYVYQSNMISLGQNWSLFVIRVIRDLFMILSLYVVLLHNSENAAYHMALLSVLTSILYLVMLVFRQYVGMHFTN